MTTDIQEKVKETVIETDQVHLPTENEDQVFDNSAKCDEMDLVEINEAAERRSALHDLLDDPTPLRDVTTTEIDQNTGLPTSDNVETEHDPTPS